MKKLISVSVFMLFVISLMTSAAENKPAKQVKAVVASATKVEVYYFHYSRRCETCQAVESESKSAIATLYPSQYKKGQITFKSVNLDEKTSDAVAKKCKAEGQALLVIGGSKRTDLTDKGFIYARSSPEKLRAELKKTIDPLL
ncbi:MAG: nitrophenyl compound nitroreductase subunit ArsF family protein [Paludibacter sp.]